MPLDSYKYDNLLFEILQNEGQITPFLDAIFNFLYRRTDFYKVQTEKNQSLGFPDGLAENLLRQVFLKYNILARRDDELRSRSEVPEVASEEIVGEGDYTSDLEKRKKKTVARNLSRNMQSDGDCYNGANMDTYKWSQTQNEIDVRVKVSEEILSGKNVRVEVRPDHLFVSVREQRNQANSKWNILVDGRFPHRVNAEDAIWTLIPGDHIHVNLEKREERLWECLLEGDPKLDTRKLDNTLPMDSLDEESQNVVQELMYNQQQKMLGKPTSKEQKLQKILKDAWDLEGSPFKGQPFDLSKVNISNPEGLSRDI